MPFPTLRSQLDPDALAAWLAARYGWESAPSCELIRRGMNDVYLVRHDGDDYILRISARSWRDVAEVDAELRVLDRLGEAGGSVVAPILAGDGSLFGIVEAAEGPRAATLFAAAPGRVEDPPDPEGYRLFGRALARLHVLADGARCGDLPTTYDWHTCVIEPLAEHRAEFDEAAAALELARDLAPKWSPVLAESDVGFVHGDAHTGNCCVDRDRLTFFDFECAGRGPRAYDLAVLRNTLEVHFAHGEYREQHWWTFRAGYSEVRPWPDEQLIPAAQVLRIGWQFAVAARLCRERPFGQVAWALGRLHRRLFRLSRGRRMDTDPDSATRPDDQPPSG